MAEGLGEIKIPERFGNTVFRPQNNNKRIIPTCPTNVVRVATRPSFMSCEAQVKSGAIEGMVLGAIIGGMAGLLDACLALIEGDGRIRFFDRLVGGVLQGGSLGLLIGAIISIIKYC